jgi:hypothetical protein
MTNTPLVALVADLKQTAERIIGPRERLLVREAAATIERLAKERDEYFLQWQNLRLRGDKGRATL